MILDSTKAAALAHAVKEHPREACGLVVMVRGHETYWPCRNMAVGTDHFAIDPKDYAAAEDAGDIVGVFHSHPDYSAEPGQADKVACEQSGLPWHIVSVPGGVWRSITPSGYVVPLLGRDWAHGVLDCYSLIRDYYKQVLGIELPDFPRLDEWWYNGGNMYMDHYRAAGFEIVPAEELRAHDVIVMQVLSNVPNHGAIYLPGDKILHQLHRRLSCIDVYGGYYRDHTYCVLRYCNADSETLRRISETVWART